MKPKMNDRLALRQNWPEPEYKDIILRRIRQCNARVLVVGAGYVGLPLACRCAASGHRTTVLDPDTKKVESIRRGESYISDISSGVLEFLVNTEPEKGTGHNLKAVSKWSDAPCPDVAIICVPTPLNKAKEPDISIVMDVVDRLPDTWPCGWNPLVVLESTVYPGFTREMVHDRLRVPTAFSPERVDPGNRKYGIRNTPKLVGGVDAVSSLLANEFYRTIVNEVVPVSSCEVAEMTKVFENTFRMVNIGLVNEAALMCRALGIDSNEMIDAAATKPFGFMPFRPGPGAGGNCVPLDPHYLAWKLRTVKYHSRFISLADQVNSSMPRHVVDLIVRALNKNEKSVKNSKVLIDGVSYKPGVGDLSESPALDIIEILCSEYSADVWYFDPFVDSMTLSSGRGIPRITKMPEPGEFDCLVIATNHPNVDHGELCRLAGAVVDTRNVTKDFRKDISNIEVL